MSVGFVMLAHAALDRAAEVARHLAARDCPVIIHIDRRASKRAFADLERRIAGQPNIHLAPRLRCDWGTWSLVEASRSSAARLLRLYPDLDHVFLISGSCLPIKPVEDLKALLARNRDTDFIESVTINDVPWTKNGLCEERFTLTFPFAWKRKKWLFDLWVDVQRRFGRRRKVPFNMKPHMGSQWWCLSRQTLQRILNDPERGQIDRYFRRVWIPDESYYQTMVRHYDCKVESRSLTLARFDFQGKPHVFYDDHLVLLRQSSAYFARKIWPGARRLYHTLNQPRGLLGDAVRQPTSFQTDRLFSEAIERRTRGRAGLVMASRFPREGFENGLTVAPYAVFHGFSDVFEEFPAWLSAKIATRAHGHLFALERAEFCGDQTHYAGALSSSAALRDHNPQAFLTNLIWNTRGEHQSFLFSPRDSQQICEFLARDPNAMLSIISGAWALPLMRSGRPIDDVRAEAARLQQIETEQLERLRERRTRAQVRIWTLAEFLDRPAAPLQAILDDLSGPDAPYLTEMPRLSRVRGLDRFLQSLRNAGMNPHLAGEVALSAQMADRHRIRTDSVARETG